MTAETLYEAVAQAWRIFGESEWNADGGRPPSVFVVRVKRPEIEHKVRTQDFESWLGAAPKPGGDGIEESIAEDSRKRELATYF